MFKSITLAVLVLAFSATVLGMNYGTSYRGAKKCNSCNKILDDLTLTMLLNCRDRVATKYYDLVAVPEVIVKLLKPEMDLCLNGPTGMEADADHYPGTKDYLVDAFVSSLSLSLSLIILFNRAFLLLYSQY